MTVKVDNLDIYMLCSHMGVENTISVRFTWMFYLHINLNNWPTRCDCIQFITQLRPLLLLSWNSTTRADGSTPGWPVLEAGITVVQAPDDGCQHPKHVEHGPMNIKFISITLFPTNYTSNQELIYSVLTVFVIWTEPKDVIQTCCQLKFSD